MENYKAYVDRIEKRQTSTEVIGDSPAARQSSSISVQIPRTGHQVTLDHSYLQSEARATIRIQYMSNHLFESANLAIWIAAIVLVAAFGYAVRKLKVWVEVLLVTVFLVTEVFLDLKSADLAMSFLKAGFVAVLLLGLFELVCRFYRPVLGSRPSGRDL